MHHSMVVVEANAVRLSVAIERGASGAVGGMDAAR
jgi:hypothetical protein